MHAYATIKKMDFAVCMIDYLALFKTFSNQKNVPMLLMHVKY